MLLVLLLMAMVGGIDAVAKGMHAWLFYAWLFYAWLSIGRLQPALRARSMRRAPVGRHMQSMHATRCTRPPGTALSLGHRRTLRCRQGARPPVPCDGTGLEDGGDIYLVRHTEYDGALVQVG